MSRRTFWETNFRKEEDGHAPDGKDFTWRRICLKCRATTSLLILSAYRVKMIPVVILQTAPKMQRNSKVRIGLLGVDDGHFDTTSSKLSVHFRYFLSHAHMCTLRHGIGYCLYSWFVNSKLKTSWNKPRNTEAKTWQEKTSTPGPGPGASRGPTGQRKTEKPDKRGRCTYVQEFDWRYGNNCAVAVTNRSASSREKNMK